MNRPETPHATPIPPTDAQRAAAAPASSAWVSANAGSGKTRVLIHRVARLLLAGARPERILCLTYTRAAAAEMQRRLFQELGRWSMLEDRALAAEIIALEGRSDAPSADLLAAARRLFARALETPGGLRIQTIHAFCEHLLRRFPLEAGIAPRFRVADERETAALDRRLRAALAGDPETEAAFEPVARRVAEAGIDALMAAIGHDRHRFPRDPTQVEPRLAPHFDTAVMAGHESVAAAALAEIDWQEVATLATAFAAGGSKAQDLATGCLSPALEAQDEPVLALQYLIGATHTGQGAPRALRGLVTKPMAAADPATPSRFEALIETVACHRDRLAAAGTAARARELNAFAARYLSTYEAQKAAAGLLDFDDMIARTAALLTRADTAQWVLYKLDGGLDHILVDEAQDTAPAQWDVIGALAAEFFAGDGADRPDGGRTLFVVGDEKQSIYSFQGADPQVFGTMRHDIAERLSAMALSLAQPALETSFRSAPGILDFVDRVFAGEAGRGLTLDDHAPSHAASRQGDEAVIDLWSPVLPAEKAEEPDWWAPIDTPARSDPRLRLARALAAEIARMIRQDCLPLRAGQADRPIRPGDIIVLVRRRDLLARALIAALKAEGVPVAGADRLRLRDTLAAKDLMAALRVAALPDDDLSLAALLRSPLGDVDEAGLMRLAAERAQGERLSARLEAERAAFPRAADLVSDLIARADFLRPYEMLERVLIRHEGRARLIARLGPEAEDAIDELLSQALAFERRAAPSLAGFIAWFDADEHAVKREMDAAGGTVRVMTVHGAKGLEAPVVILPDTTGLPAAGQAGAPLLLPVPDGGNAEDLMLWAGPRAEDDPLTAEARAARIARDIAEHKRLLYVALTRAESRLILCAAGDPDRGADSDDDPADLAAASKSARRDAVWYRMLRAAMDAAGAHPAPPPPGIDGLQRLGPDPLRREPDDGPAAGKAAEAGGLPDWAVTPAPAEARPRRLSPSTLIEHDPAAAAPAGRGREEALAHGLGVHALLEHWPRISADATAADLVLRDAAPSLDPAGRAQALAEAQAARDLPEAAMLFGPDAIAEASVALPLPGAGGRMIGRIDWLVVLTDRVIIADFKTDRGVPADADSVPESYRAQLGAYATALEGILPDRPVEACILWTAAPRLQRIDVNQCKTAFTRALDLQP
ncbi:MAG: double-strand break repair helicase AddA [Pseudomonadota bacterium]